MKFLLDENIGKLVANFLSDKGYDVKSAIEDFRGFSDPEILQIACQEERILVTLDQDFGRMIYQSKSPHRGVILLRLKKESQENIGLDDFPTPTSHSGIITSGGWFSGRTHGSGP